MPKDDRGGARQRAFVNRSSMMSCWMIRQNLPSLELNDADDELDEGPEEAEDEFDEGPEGPREGGGDEVGEVVERVPEGFKISTFRRHASFVISSVFFTTAKKSTCST